MNKTTRTFAFGIMAGSVALSISAILRLIAGGTFVPELASQTLFSLTPGQAESFSVETFGTLAKYSVFVSAVIVNLLIYGVLAIFLKRIHVKLAQRGFLLNLVQLSFIPYFMMVAISATLLQLNELLTRSSEIQFVLIFLLLPHMVFGRVLYYLFERRRIKRNMPSSQIATAIPSASQSSHPSSPSPSSKKISRRQFITMAASAVFVTIFYFWARNFLHTDMPPMPPENTTPPPIPPPNLPKGSIFAEAALAPLLASEVTPNDKLYRIDTNIIVPSVDANSWRLSVKGLINSGPLQFTYEQLKAMPSISEYATLECISDKVAGDLISTALWKGVRLKSLLEMAHVKSEAIYIVFRCYDGYDVGIPIDRGLLEGTILAYEMNGVPLPIEHGFPLRVIVPGLYGMMNAKWITDIELVDKIYEGFWQRRGWANNAQYKTHSKIVFPGDALRNRFQQITATSGIVVGSKSPIAGLAFAGDRGISKVEVSIDGGNNWQVASVKDPLSANCWVLWALDWVPQAKGKYNILVRATDGAGNLQTSEITDNYPSGATGYHSIDTNLA
jgi:DMSO/TMAO reductase YedYZ molybdopterin-dependent catalytic subunit